MVSRASAGTSSSSVETTDDPLTKPNIREVPAAISDVTLVRDDDEEEFTYTAQVEDPDLEESFMYPGITDPRLSPSPPQVTPHISGSYENPLTAQAPGSGIPSPAQLEAIYAAASSGDLAQLHRLFGIAWEDASVNAFALANDATSRTGLTPLHAACSRGHLDIVQWLIKECGAMTDLEDKEGETALHKASLNGHLPILIYLVSLETGGADVHAQDADGYTALHNACSKGYLDIVRWLCEKGGANVPVIRGEDGSSTPGVDVRSKGGWSPLMNAASKGHLPVVRYLLAKQSANPLIRNNWGETAFDIAAAVFEIFICQVLQQAEAQAWQALGSITPYNPLAAHSTVPLIIYEHQRLDTRFKTLAVNGGRPRFSTYHLGRPGRPAPFELLLWGGESLPVSQSDTTNGRIPAWRSNVQLPFLDDAFTLPPPNVTTVPSSRDGAERSHFWMSDWTLDLTDPRVNVNDGWQYSRSLDDPEERWLAEVPPQLERLLTGSGLVSAGLAGPSGSSFTERSNGRQSPRAKLSGSNLSWARRRRWVRVMRRRLDVSPLPFQEPDGNLYSLSEDGSLVPYVADETSDFWGQDPSGGLEMTSAPSSVLAQHQDYVARARYLAAGSSGTDSSEPSHLSAADIKRTINKLSRAVSELRLGILNDRDTDRRTHAEVLINTYNRELQRTRLTAGANGLFTTDDQDDNDLEDDDNESDDDSFHYPSIPGSTTTARPPSIRSYHTDYFSFARASSSRQPIDLMPQLSQAAEFRVPTNDAPQKVPARWNAPLPHPMHSQWEKDEQATECRTCKRRFTFYFRKHCRRCGRVYCNGCSSHRALLDPSDIVHDPSAPGDHSQVSSLQRVCQSCFDEVNTDVPGQLRSSQVAGMETVVVQQQSLTVPGTRRGDSSSQISDLADCPVCGQSLSELGPANVQEAHVRTCLDGGSGPGVQQAGKYIVYKLPAESVLIGTECVICLEEFEKATLVARLSCLCTFHNHCLSAWLQRGRACPVHARDT